MGRVRTRLQHGAPQLPVGCQQLAHPLPEVVQLHLSAAGCVAARSRSRRACRVRAVAALPAGGGRQLCLQSAEAGSDEVVRWSQVRCPPAAIVYNLRLP